jgi:UPF0716 family protein affecting phage T7 exclusion
MTKPHGTVLSSSARNLGGRWLYPLLLAVQTFGAALLYWQGLPIYRSLSSDVTAHDPQTETLVWTATASALIQVAYWTGYHAHLQPPRFVNVVIGHVVLFAARLLFVLATAIFTFLFIAKQLENQMSTLRYLVILFGLFSLFCYTRELERFGKRLMG